MTQKLSAKQVSFGLFKFQIFNGIREKQPELLDKVMAVSGDITSDNLGLNMQDESELVENVQIIFHCAAVIKFNEKLKDAVNSNTTGIWRIIQLALKMKNLQVLSYMSTIFSHCYSPELYEKHYTTGLDAMDIIRKTQTLSDNELDELEKQL